MAAQRSKPIKHVWELWFATTAATASIAVSLVIIHTTIQMNFRTKLTTKITLKYMYINKLNHFMIGTSRSSTKRRARLSPWSAHLPKTNESIYSLIELPLDCLFIYLSCFFFFCYFFREGFIWINIAGAQWSQWISIILSNGSAWFIS